MYRKNMASQTNKETKYFNTGQRNEENLRRRVRNNILKRGKCNEKCVQMNKDA
jgi:hypothetical protein